MTGRSLSVAAIGFFIGSSCFYVCVRRRKRSWSGRLAHSLHGDPSDIEEQVAELGMEQQSFFSLSGRGQLAALPPVPPHWSAFIRCLQDPCEPSSNPEGHIALCLAENKLCAEMLASRLVSSETAVTAFSDSIAYGYNGFLGLPAAREAVAYFLERRFFIAGQSEGGWSSPAVFASSASLNSDTSRNGSTRAIPPVRPQSPGPDPERIDPEHCAIGAGVGSLLSHVMFILLEPNDAVLIPAPYYASAEKHLHTIAQCVSYPVHMENPSNGPTSDELKKAAARAEGEGLAVRALLLTNPNDPLGVVYSPLVLKNAIGWARARGMHTVVDEIYALSVQRKDAGFESVVRVLNNDLGNDVHCLYGLSKDFGACGFRIGVLYTHNTLLLAALANLNVFSGVSHPMQLILADILTHDEFLDTFTANMRAQLKWSYSLCCQKLEEMVVPFVPAEGGLSVYVNLSNLLPEPTFVGERKLARLIEDAARVVLTPGEYMRDRRPGWFRLCFASVSPDVLEIATERLSYLVKKIRRYHFDDLDAKCLSDVPRAGMLMRVRRTPSVNLAGLAHKENNSSTRSQ